YRACYSKKKLGIAIVLQSDPAFRLRSTERKNSMNFNNVSLGQGVSFWKKELASAASTLEFPADRRRSAPVRSNEVQSFTFPPELFHRVEALALPLTGPVDALEPDKQPGRNPIFQVLIAEQDVDSEPDSGIRKSLVWPPGTELLDIAIMVRKSGNAPSFAFRYDSDLFEPG